MDYRFSHLHKGEAYDNSFSDNTYRRFIWRWEMNVLDSILKVYYPEKAQINYLDFACGTGRIIGFLEDKVADSTGIDVSDSMLAVAKSKNKRSSLITADLTSNNVLRGKRFDLITAFRFFLNAQPELRNQVLDVLSNLLPENGYLVFNIHMNKGCMLSILLGFYFWIRGMSKDFNSMSYQNVNRMLQKHGFKIVKTYHFGVIPISNENTRMPLNLLEKIETFASQFDFLRSSSCYVIYVCKKS
jgi:predicted TPR repeat methyltransferase